MRTTKSHRAGEYAVTYCPMKTLLFQAPALGAFLVRARRESACDERRLGAFVALVESEQSLISALQRNMAGDGLTEAGFLILSYLLQEGEVLATSGEIARAVGLPQRIVSDVLARLEISGLIKRSRAAAEGNRLVACVTPAGRRVFSSALNHSLDSIGEMMSVVNEDDISALKEICLRLQQPASDDSPNS